MHVISKRPFNTAGRIYPNHRQALLDVYRGLKKGVFGSPDAMRQVFPSLGNFKYRKKWWVIDVAGNHLRIVAYIHFNQNRIYVKYILTHAEYDRLCRRCAKGELK